LITKILWFKYLNVLKKYSTNKIPTVGVILLFIMSSVSIAYPQPEIVFEEHARAITWDVSLNFNEPDGAYDYTIFGEAPDANDGPPADAYDTVKPPAPMPSYIRAYFNDNIPFPYNNLWKDYRHYPAVNKVWNLTVQWVPEDSESPTTITISWSSSEINTSEYATITLCTNGGTPLRNMLVYNYYSFSCPAFLLQRFKIICIANQAPYAPDNPSPSNASGGVPVNTDLSWTCSDPNGDTLRYDVYFGASSSPPLVASDITVPTYDPGTMSPGITYYWKIVAKDIYNAETPGPLWHFQTNSLPNQPGNPNPINNSDGLPLNTILSWTCTDPNSDPLTYDVRFGTSSTPPIVSHNQTITTYNPGPLSYGTTYYWRIIAWDLNSGPRAGPLWQFTTNSRPNPPSNPNPANNSINISTTTNLIWTGGDPDSGDTVTYDVYLGLTSTPTIVSHNQSAILYNPPVDLFNFTLYYWKIVSWDNHGANRSGPLWHFTTGGPINHPPNKPNNPSPANGSINIPLNADLSWLGGDPDGDNVTYDVYFGTTNPPPLKSHNQTALVYDPGPLTSLTTYYWRIKAWDDLDASIVGPLWHFKTVNVPPNVPSNPSPQNCSTQIAINTDLSWTGGDPDGDPVTYDVYFGSSPSSLTKIKSNISGTTCFVSNLVYSQKYYWRVRAWDNHGHNTTGPLWSFTTILDTTPPSVGITQPKPGFFYYSLFGGSIRGKFFIFFTTFIFGHIKVIATAYDTQSGMDKVEFYVDNKLQATDKTPENSQYTWDWDEYVPLFPYKLKVIAYDNCGLTSEWEMPVRKLL
jgi:hypothetical protein